MTGRSVGVASRFGKGGESAHVALDGAFASGDYVDHVNSTDCRVKI
jgi:hypothetical protein